MELSKKTTILFSPDLYEHLVRRARREGTSLGQLVRSACAEKYGFGSNEERLGAVQELCRLSLPVGTPREMARESVPPPENLMP